MLIWGQAPFFNICHIGLSAEVVTNVELRGLAPNQHLLKSDAEAEVETGVAFAGPGDVQREAQDGQVEIRAAADATVKSFLILEFLAERVRRPRVHERFDTEPADRQRG